MSKIVDHFGHLGTMGGAFAPLAPLGYGPDERWLKFHKRCGLTMQGLPYISIQKSSMSECIMC